MRNEPLTLEIEGRTITVRAVLEEHPESRSDSYRLYDAQTGKATDYFLKRAAETKTAQLASGKTKSRQAQHMLAKYSALKALHIPLEPFLGTYEDEKGKYYIITKKVGTDLYSYCQDPKNSSDLSYRSENYFRQICKIMGVLHSNCFSHEHPHNRNFTILNHAVYLIDIGALVRNKTVDWNSLYKDETENDMGHFFGADYFYIRNTFYLLIPFIPCFDNDKKIRYKALEGFSQIISFYPLTEDMKYLTLYEFAKRFLGLDLPTLDGSIISQLPLLRFLKDTIIRLKKKNATYFQDVDLT